MRARSSGALYGIANGIEDHLERAEEKRHQIFHVTWSYKYGSRREDKEELGQIATDEGATKTEPTEPASGDRDPWTIVCDMERPLDKAEKLADAIRLAAHGMHALEECQIGSLLAVVDEAEGHLKTLGKERGHLFRLLHPNRAEHDRKGWPDDDADSEQQEGEP